MFDIQMTKIMGFCLNTENDVNDKKWNVTTVKLLYDFLNSDQNTRFMLICYSSNS